MYQEQARGGIQQLQEKLKTFNHDTHLLPVLYKHQIHMVHSATGLLHINMYLLSNALYRSKRDGKLWRFNEITSLEFNNNDPEFLSVVDQGMMNTPVEFEYVQVPTPRYAEHEEYYMIQIKQRNRTSLQ